MRAFRCAFGDPRSNAPPLWIALPVAAAVAAITLWLLFESKVQVLADEKNVYVHGLPAEDGSPARYRISGGPYEYAEWDTNHYYVTVPLPMSARPERGTVPIDIEYKTMVGFTRTKRIAFDVDEEQIRQFAMGAGSSGWRSSFYWDGDRVQLRVENERCVRWRYGLDDESAKRDVPERAESIHVGDARRVTFETNICHRLRTCSVVLDRDSPRDPVVRYGCL